MKKAVRYMCLVAVFTALMCILAPISIPIGPVPITLATLMVYLIASLFSVKISPLIIVLYIVIGGLGLPVFSNYSSGLGVLSGPTGGYILGYIPAAVIESIIIDKNKERKWVYPLAMLSGTAIIYLLGTAWFIYAMKGKYTLVQALMTCVVPFLIGDGLKIVLSSLISMRLRKFFDSQLALSQRQN